MQTLDDAVQSRVAERLAELQGWAEVIFESLLRDAPGAAVTVSMLEGLVDPRSMRELRELSWTLRDKLYVLRIPLEASARSLRECRPAP